MFRILVDGTIDLPSELLAASDFTVVPQKVVVDSTCATSRLLGETGRTRPRWENAGRGGGLSATRRLTTASTGV
ncbi:MAG: DegV family protein [Brockia lithotrophica]|nr:DegV family protein [Brockia lithotrophica]